MLVNDISQKSGKKTGLDRRSTRSWRADDRSDISEALMSPVLALILIGVAIVGSYALRESFDYFSYIFSM